MVAPDFIHGPSGICRASMLGGENHRAEAGFGKPIILWCTNTTGIASAAIILAEVAVFGS
jgi:hypothetical protein